jgi:hypothetical protein
MAPMVEFDRVYARACLTGVWSQAVVICGCDWQEPGFSRRENAFICNVLYKELL